MASASPSGKMVNIFRHNSSTTASYIYTVVKSTDGESKDGGDGLEIRLALGRKIPQSGRLRLGSAPNTGAAGTTSKYHGKWGTFGGGKEKSNPSDLRAAISEINDEADVVSVLGKKLDPRRDVNVSWMKKSTASPILTLDLALQVSGTTVFLFYMDPLLFFNLFPPYPTARRDGGIVSNSHGEIDVCTSMTLDRIVEMQENEIIHTGNNFILSYVVSSYNNIIAPKLTKMCPTVAIPHWRSVRDTAPRDPYEFPVTSVGDLRNQKFGAPGAKHKYKEVSRGKYIIT